MQNLLWRIKNLTIFRMFFFAQFSFIRFFFSTFSLSEKKTLDNTLIVKTSATHFQIPKKNLPFDNFRQRFNSLRVLFRSLWQSEQSLMTIVNLLTLAGYTVSTHSYLTFLKCFCTHQWWTDGPQIHVFSRIFLILRSKSLDY